MTKQNAENRGKLRHNRFRGKYRCKTKLSCFQNKTKQQRQKDSPAWIGYKIHRRNIKSLDLVGCLEMYPASHPTRGQALGERGQQKFQADLRKSIALSFFPRRICEKKKYTRVELATWIFQGNRSAMAPQTFPQHSVVGDERMFPKHKRKSVTSSSYVQGGRFHGDLHGLMTSDHLKAATSH